MSNVLLTYLQSYGNLHQYNLDVPILTEPNKEYLKEIENFNGYCKPFCKCEKCFTLEKKILNSIIALQQVEPDDEKKKIALYALAYDRRYWLGAEKRKDGSTHLAIVTERYEQGFEHFVTYFLTKKTAETVLKGIEKKEITCYVDNQINMQVDAYKLKVELAYTSPKISLLYCNNRILI